MIGLLPSDWQIKMTTWNINIVILSNTLYDEHYHNLHRDMCLIT